MSRGYAVNERGYGMQSRRPARQRSPVHPFVHAALIACKPDYPLALCTCQTAGICHSKAWSREQRAMVAARVAPPAAVTSVAQSGVNMWPVLQHSIAVAPGHFLLGLAAFIAGCAFAVFVVASLPSIVALRRTAIALEALSRAVEQEVPDTAAALRLSGFELSDCIEEFAALSNDLTQGVRASARAVATAEQGIREGAAAAAGLVTSTIIPHVKQRVPQAAEAVEGILKRNASLLEDTAAAVQLAEVAKMTARQLRGLLAATQVTRRIPSLRASSRQQPERQPQ